MAQLTDTFSKDLIAPFKSEVTFLNNFQSTQFDYIKPSFRDASNTNFTKYVLSYTTSQPICVKDMYLKFLIQRAQPTPTTLLFPAISTLGEVDGIGRRIASLKISINNTRINTPHDYPNSLNRFFTKGRLNDNFEECVLGRLWEERCSPLSASLTAVAQQLNRNRSQRYLRVDPLTVLYPLGYFCNYFEQDTWIPENSVIQLEFTLLLTPGFQYNIGMNRTDNFVYTTVAPNDGGSNLLDDVEMVIKKRLIAREVFPHAQASFKAVWREFLPWFNHTYPVAVASSFTTVTSEYRAERKTTTLFNEVPEFIALWVNYLRLDSFGLGNYKSLGRIIQAYTFAPGVTYDNYNLGDGNTTYFINPESIALSFSRLKISINQTTILDYNADVHDITLDEYLLNEQIDFNYRNFQSFISNEYTAPIYFINLTSNKGNHNIFSKLSSGELTLEYSLQRYSNTGISFGTAKTPSVVCFASVKHETAVDAYRRSWRN